MKGKIGKIEYTTIEDFDETNTKKERYWGYLR